MNSNILSIYRFLTDEFIRKDNHYCSLKGPIPYSTLLKAKQKCSQISTCTMFYDLHGRGSEFYLCNNGNIETSSKGSILYIKDTKGKVT